MRCRFSQSSGVVSNRRARRSAVSGVMPAAADRIEPAGARSGGVQEDPPSGTSAGVLGDVAAGTDDTEAASGDGPDAETAGEERERNGTCVDSVIERFGRIDRINKFLDADGVRSEATVETNNE